MVRRERFPVALSEDALTTLAVSSDPRYPARAKIFSTSSGRRASSVLLLLVVGCSSPPAVVPSSDPGGAGVAVPIDPGALRAATAPGVELHRLAPLVGEWTVQLQSLDGEGRAVETLASGSAVITTELDGRYFHWRTELSLGGFPVRAQGLLGHDPRHGVYQFLWLSELAPGMRVASGRGDPERGGIYLEIAERDPESGVLQRARTVLALQDADHFTLEQWGLDPTSGDWIPQQRTHYTRVPAPG